MLYKKVFKTNSVTLTKNHGFREQKMVLYRELSGGLSGRPAEIPSAWWYGRRSKCFLHRLFPNTLNHVFWLLAGGRTVFFLSLKMVSQRGGLFRGAVAVKAANNCCSRSSFLFHGHNPHFFSHWKFANTLGDIFTRILLKSSVRWKRCDATAAYSSQLEVTG